VGCGVGIGSVCVSLLQYFACSSAVQVGLCVTCAEWSGIPECRVDIGAAGGALVGADVGPLHLFYQERVVEKAQNEAISTVFASTFVLVPVPPHVAPCVSQFFVETCTDSFPSTRSDT
jgi:hypothetical protein